MLRSALIPSGQMHVAAQAWGRREMTADVAPDARYITLVALANGAGQCWIADFSLAPEK